MPEEESLASKDSNDGGARTVRALVVDDDDMSLRLTEQIVRELVEDVSLAVDGADAQEQLRQQPCDLVVTDLVMPRVSGWELAEWLRQHYPDTAIIFITGSRTSGIEAETRRLGVPLVKKPIDPDELWDRLEEALQRLERSRSS